MGATPQGVWQEFRSHITDVQIAAAFMVYDGRRNRVSITTILDRVDVDVERRLARIERRIERDFAEQPMEFYSFHRRGRNLEDLIPGERLEVTFGSAPRRAVGE